MPQIFKGKSTGGTWHEGFYVERQGAYSGNDVAYIHSADGFDHEVDPQTVCTFTGVFDRSRARVFENDILQDLHGNVGYVMYDLRTCKFVIMYNDYTDGLDECRAHEMRIVGNRVDDDSLLCADVSLNSNPVDKLFDTPEDAIDYVEVFYSETVSEGFGKHIADKCRDILQYLHTEPRIRPSAYTAVEFEFSRDDGSVLTFEVYSGRTAWKMVLAPDSSVTRGNICSSECKRIDAMVENFYEEGAQ